jgi:hypothetical protein
MPLSEEFHAALIVVGLEIEENPKDEDNNDDESERGAAQ